MWVLLPFNIICSLGIPRVLVRYLICWFSLSPGNKGTPVKSYPSIQPVLQMSIFEEY